MRNTVNDRNGSGYGLPRLAIGIPVYNGEAYIASVLDCFAAQTFGDYEIVVCDNASTDGTYDICVQYASRDPRVRVYRNEKNLGAIGNFNRVFELSSRTEFFRWAASDDLCHPRYLESCIRILDENPDVVLAHSAVAFIDGRGAEFPRDPKSGDYIDPLTGIRRPADGPEIGDSGSPLLRYWQVLAHAQWGTHMFGVIRRPALERTRLMMNFPSSDRPMLAELALLGRFKSSNECLFSKRFHENVSWALSKKDLKAFLATGDNSYAQRPRQLLAYLTTVDGKPVGFMTKLICRAMVIAHSARTVMRAAIGKAAAEAADGTKWRQSAKTTTAVNS